MKKRTVMKVVVAAIALVCVCMTTAACVASGLHEGINRLYEKYKPVADERMYAEAPDYGGYAFVLGGETMKFRMKFPDRIEENKRYPLVVFLHGAGDNGTDNRKHMYRSVIDGIADYAPEDCFVVLPQTPKETDWTDSGYDGLYNALFRALLENFPIDRARVYLTGMSMGGFGTVYQAMKRPELYAAIMPLCGGSLWTDLSALKNMPVWVAHSDDDPAVDPIYSHFLYAELLRLGNDNVHCTWFADQGHQITKAFYAQPEVWTWLFAQKKTDAPGA